jgi:hypothetical protein
VAAARDAGVHGVLRHRHGLAALPAVIFFNTGAWIVIFLAILNLSQIVRMLFGGVVLVPAIVPAWSQADSSRWWDSSPGALQRQVPRRAMRSPRFRCPTPALCSRVLTTRWK